ncbi:MAG: hypothetical protein JRN09_01025 [Nitrososphaerota archaeon]|nr:hypothetical protein [Nitrososphaerota archaeon]
MSQPQSFSSSTSSWCGKAVTTISGQGAGTVAGSTTWKMNFTIAADNSISGTATGTGSIEVSAAGDQGTAAPTGTMDIGGSYDPGSNNVNLTLDFVHASSAIDVTTPASSAQAEGQWAATNPDATSPVDMQLVARNWSDIINGQVQQDLTTLTNPCGATESETEATGPVESSPWQAPPIRRVNGGTATKTYNYTGQGGETLTVTTVLTIYPSISIQRTDSGDSTFITTDTPAFTVDVSQSGADPSSASWQVSADSQYAGPPSPASGTGATFSFQPASPSNNPTTGSVNGTPNQPLQYRVQVSVGSFVATSELTQDEIDTLRQEYVDYQYDGVPPRANCVQCPAAALNSLNNGNYGYMVDGFGTDHAMESVLQDVIGGTHGAVQVIGGFRCPQRNAQVHGAARSEHTLGRALDLGPGTGALTFLDICVAAQNLGYIAHAFCEGTPQTSGSQPIRPCGTPCPWHAGVPCAGVTHIHIDW